MEEISRYKSYSEFKEKLDNNIKQQAAGFVEAGYLLKIARDTDILAESGYKSITEFAKVEYGFEKDIVSRYIYINDRYSQNGYSDKLDVKYEGYGISKLTEMLQLPDSVIEEMSPLLTKREIIEIKKEYQEEKSISDIEVMLEEKEVVEIEIRTLLEEAIFYYIKEHKECFDALHAATFSLGNRIEKILDVLAKSGVAMLSTRIPQTGKVIINIKGSDEDIVVIKIRTDEKKQYTWSEMIDAIRYLYEKGSTWSDFYKEEQKVAPVQPTLVSGADKKESELEEKVTKNDNMTVEIKEILTEKEFFPEPVQLNSICYTCEYNSVCGQKSNITKECNEYVNKAEAEKTEEQKYSEQQDAIDKQTEKVLQQRADEEKLEHLPSEHDLHKVHEIKIAHEYFDDVALERKTFELRKNNRDYKVGDELHMIEYENGEQTGRELAADIIYMIEDYSGLEEGYCILGIDITMAKEREDN